LWVIDPFGKMKDNLKLTMIWLFVSPKNVIVLRLNLVCEGMLCEIVWLHWGCLVLFIVVWTFCPADVYWNLIRLELCSLLKSSLESNVDFSMVPDVADVHYNFQIKKENLSCPFYVSFVGETFIFLETCSNGIVLSIWTVIFPWYLIQQTSIIIFKLKKRFWVVHFMSVLLVRHLFF